jgi:hypothetical protein
MSTSTVSVAPTIAVIIKEAMVGMPDSFNTRKEIENAMKKIAIKKKEDMNINEINRIIKESICYQTIGELSDANLLQYYKECPSVKKEIVKLEDILKKYIDNVTKQKIIDEYLLELIPAGTKGVIRGNRFNNIVKARIIMLHLDKNRFDVRFETKCASHNTSEIPDWYILDKVNNKVLLGMNQLDLWSGGQQTNRGSKYIFNNEHNTNDSKLLCVVCYEIHLKSYKNKTYKLFETGFINNTLCYLNNLHNTITSYFQL